jgi:aspartyl aminopeptidase
VNATGKMPVDAKELLDFLDHGKSPYHASQRAREMLRDAGFVELDERASWSPEAGLRGLVQRGGGSVVAFEVGRRPPAESGYLVIGAHTDSPNLRLKPNHDTHGIGMVSLSVEPYGGLLLSTWLDRPLGLAGRVATRSGEVRLLDLEQTRLTIPSLAIHLQRDVNTQGLVLNPQQHLRPILDVDFDEPQKSQLKDLLVSALTSLGLSVEAEDICAFDLCLFDATKAGFEGKSGTLVASGRIDNLVSCCAALNALILAGPVADATRVLVLYDHEEVGSRSFAGAQSTLLGDVLGRLAQRMSPGDPEATCRAMAASILLSADMAHAVHPNYADKHDDLHRPLLGRGPVLKTNAGQSYATDSISAAALHAAAHRANIVLQQFVTRSDMPCGSTIGPLAAARQGIRTVDVGNPMLAMHSCRELCATADYPPYVELLTQWYRTETPLPYRD